MSCRPASSGNTGVFGSDEDKLQQQELEACLEEEEDQQ